MYIFDLFFLVFLYKEYQTFKVKSTIFFILFFFCFLFFVVFDNIRRIQSNLYSTSSQLNLYNFGTIRDWTHENNAATFDSLSIWTKKDTRWERKNVTTFVEFLFFHYQIISVKLHKYFHIASICVNNESEMYCEPPRNVVRSTFLLYNIIWFFFLFDFDFNFIWDFDQSQKEIFLFSNRAELRWF